MVTIAELPREIDLKKRKRKKLLDKTTVHSCLFASSFCKKSEQNPVIRGVQTEKEKT